MDEAGALRAKPRDRIMGAAQDLFRKHGIKGVGVDAIAEAAGSNKMTLYRHFDSKDELVVACLASIACDADSIWRCFEEEHPGDPMAQLRAWVRFGAQHLDNDGRGCDFANAAVELKDKSHPAHHVIEDFKIAQRNRLATLCSRAGVRDADLLADALSLLLEGARVSRQSVGADGPSAHFIQTAEAMIAVFAGAKSGEVGSGRGT